LLLIYSKQDAKLHEKLRIPKCVNKNREGEVVKQVNKLFVLYRDE